jgi:hypothetical protein
MGVRGVLTGVAGGRVGQKRGKVKKAHDATPARPYIRKALDDYYVKAAARQAARDITARRVAAWQLRTARGMGRDVPAV